MIVNPEVQHYFQLLVDKKFKEAEELLRILKGVIATSKKGKGYWQALEGLFLTYKSNSERDLYILKIVNSVENLDEVKKEFTAHVSNPLHDDYDQGYFEALVDFLEVLAPHLANRNQ